MHLRLEPVQTLQPGGAAAADAVHHSQSAREQRALCGWFSPPFSNAQRLLVVWQRPRLELLYMMMMHLPCSVQTAGRSAALLADLPHSYLSLVPPRHLQLTSRPEDEPTPRLRRDLRSGKCADLVQQVQSVLCEFVGEVPVALLFSAFEHSWQHAPEEECVEEQAQGRVQRNPLVNLPPHLQRHGLALRLLPSVHPHHSRR